MLLAACATLPPLAARHASTALADTAGTRLAKALAAEIAAHPGKSGVHDLARARDSFAARVLLAAAADRTLDVQYYIWRDDEAGELLFDALWNAAHRGVRVRLLLDDNNTRGLDSTLAALDAHPSIEVRLYNPFVLRNARGLGFLTDFTRLNRRMHNKSFTADNQASVVGGRNIGNEYFDVGSGVAFADLDVLVVGPAVREVSRTFDLYWNSASAYPVTAIVGAPQPGAAAAMEARFAEARASPDSRAYLETVRTTPLLRDLLEDRLDFEWTTVTVVADDPRKTLEANPKEHLLLPGLELAFGPAHRSFDLVSPYFVPGDDGAQTLVALAGRGVKLRILTNSLSASDAFVVHAGYARHRKALLRAGAEIFELKRLPTDDPKRKRLGSSSSAALHAKSYAVDRQRIFIGSFNFDQRSAFLNTEMGVVIESPRLAGELDDLFRNDVVLAAYRVRLGPDGQSLEWVERTAAGEIVHHEDPETSAWLRAQVQFLSLLPIEWLL